MKQKNKIFKTKLISLIMSCFTLFFCFSQDFIVNADTNKLNDKYNSIQSKIDESEQVINSLVKERKNEQEYVDSLMLKIEYTQDKIQLLFENKTKLQAEIDSIQKEVTSVEEEIIVLSDDISKKEKEFNFLYDEYCVRLKAMYISGNTSPLELILTGDDISTMLTRAEMVKQVSKHDADLLNNLMNKMEHITKEKAALNDRKEELKAKKTALNNENDELTQILTEYEKTEKSLSNDVERCNVAIKNIDIEKAEVMETLSTNREELQEVENEIQAAINKAQSSASQTKPDNSNNNSASKPSNDVTSSTTKPSETIDDSEENDSYQEGDSNVLSYPTSYRTLSAGYPNYSSGAYHGGVDWPCPTGTPVKASASGTVLIAKKLNYSYGYYVLIDHGNGLSTLYAHNSQLCVSEGDYVQRGELIAYSGSTGNSTGPHVHFEVRLNGARVNPMAYLK